MNKTAWLCRALKFSNALRLKQSCGDLVILAYHRVLDSVSEDYPFDREVISCTAKEFEREMAFVRERFDVISFANLEDVSNMKHPLIITFDDGYKDNYDIVLPILAKYGVKATFFISTGYVETGEIPWWDELSYIMKSGCDDSDYSTIGDLIAKCKTLPNAERLQLIDNLKKRYGSCWAELKKDLFMSWSDIKALSGAGMEIGGHTVNHPVLSNLESQEELFSELTESKQALENEIRKPVNVFSYPVGGDSAVSDDVVMAVKNAGYRYACKYVHGVNSLPLKEPLKLLRIKAEVGDDFDRFRAKVLFPRLVKY